MKFMKTNLMSLAKAGVPQGAEQDHGAEAEGLSLFADKMGMLGIGVNVGGDIIYMPGGKAFPLHTHPGHHVLVMIHGKATVAYDGVVHTMLPWDFFVIPGNEVHNVAATDDSVFIAVGWPRHKALGDPKRMTIVE